MRGKKGFTPLHYAVVKNNHEAFIFILRLALTPLDSRDDAWRTPRGLCLINSPFYKILYRLEMKKALKHREEHPTLFNQTISKRDANH